MSIQSVVGSLFGRISARGTKRQRLVLVNNGGSTQKDLTVADLTDVTLCREIYRNVNQQYALAGQLVRPIINNNVHFIGQPKLTGNKKALNVLKDIEFSYRNVHKMIEIDGNFLLWPRWDIRKKKVIVELISTDLIQKTLIDPLTKKVIGYILSETVYYTTEANFNAMCKITHTVTDKKQVITAEGSELNYKKTIPNPFGVLPVVLFANDRLGNDIFGHSEIEPIEPQLQLYHDLTYEAAAAQKRDGHPKLKLTTKDVQKWINNNFGPGTYADIAAGDTVLSLDNRDFFVNQGDDKIEYLYLAKTSGDFKALSETTFTNIVEGSETPEISFGANLGTSLASVKEYRPIWIKKIEAKQAERGEGWKQVYELVIMIHNFVHLSNVISDDIDIVWPKPNFVSVKERAEILTGVATAIEKLSAAMAITEEEAFDTIKEMDIVELAETYAEHKKEIERLKDEAEQQRTKLVAEEDARAKVAEAANDEEDSSSNDKKKDDVADDKKGDD